MFVDYGHMTRRGASEYTQSLFEDVSERAGGF
jgi:hypothetical protein